MRLRDPRRYDRPGLRRALADPRNRDPDLFAPDRHDRAEEEEFEEWAELVGPEAAAEIRRILREGT